MFNIDRDYKLVIKPKVGFFSFNLHEFIEYYELLFFLALREIKLRYKQTVIGASWAVIQPLFTMIVFTLIFGTMAKMPSEGIPYPIFSYSGLLLWIYFSNAVTAASMSLVGNNVLVSKIYFPRLFLPTSSCLYGILDYTIAFVILLLMMVYYQFVPGFGIILLPLLVIMSFMFAAGIGFWLSAICVKYRDVQFALPFFVQLMLFATPVIYPTSVAGKYLWLLNLNPMTGIINAHRAALLNHVPIDYGGLALSLLITLIVFITGIFYFKQTERYFADLI